MPTSVRLDPRTEQTLERLARLKGVSKSAVLREAVDALARKSLETGKPGSLFSKVEDLIGCASSGRGDLSRRTGEGFRRILASRSKRRP